MNKASPKRQGARQSLLGGLAGATRRVLRPRKAPRHSTSLPASISSIGEATGVVIDMSASGALVQTESSASSWKVGHGVMLKIEFAGPSGHSLLECAGEIVRVELDGSSVRVGMKITTQSLTKGE